MTKQYANLPVDNYALFNKSSVGLQNEPQISGQDYYAALGDVVSKIVTDKNTDVAAALTAAQATFQTNVLDQLK